MAITQEKLTQHNQSFRDFVDETNAGGVERFYPSKENGLILRNAMLAMAKEQGLSWQELWNKRLWASIYIQCIAEMETRPQAIKKSAREIEIERELADRRDGSEYLNRRRHTVEEPDPVSMMRSALVNKRKLAEDAVEVARKAAADRLAARAAENDVSSIPSVEQMRAGQLLTPKQQRALSVAQLTFYVKRLRQFETEEATRRANE